MGGNGNGDVRLCTDVRWKVGGGSSAERLAGGAGAGIGEPGQRHCCESGVRV